LGYSQYWANWITTLPWGMNVVVIGVGWLSQLLLARGVSTRWARGVLGGSCVAVGGLALLLTPFAPAAWEKVVGWSVR
jgi:MFS transporter, ACS family, D-galactonate transporter